MPDNDDPDSKGPAQPSQLKGFLLSDSGEPPKPGELRGTGFFGDTPAEVAVRYLGGCVEKK